MVCSGEGSCPNCDGKGYVIRPLILQDGTNRNRRYPCPDCMIKRSYFNAKAAGRLPSSQSSFHQFGDPLAYDETRDWEQALAALESYRVCGMEGADIFYVPAFLDKAKSASLMESLMEQMRPIFPEQGKRDHRTTLWFGEKDYTYSGITHEAHPIEGPLKIIFDEVLFRFGIRFDGVLANLYRDGRVKISPHSDSQDDIMPNSPILSLSLGATRTFKMKKKGTDTEWEKTWFLAAGDVFIMAGTTQQFWLHQVPKESDVKEERLNLTFRVMK